MTEHDVAVATPPEKKPGLRLPSRVDPAIAEQLVEQARADGVELIGPSGLLGELTKQVLETGLEVEMDEHLGYEKHAAEGPTVRTLVMARGPRRRPARLGRLRSTPFGMVTAASSRRRSRSVSAGYMAWTRHHSGHVAHHLLTG